MGAGCGWYNACMGLINTVRLPQIGPDMCKFEELGDANIVAIHNTAVPNTGEVAGRAHQQACIATACRITLYAVVVKLRTRRQGAVPRATLCQASAGRRWQGRW
jgi:hypothetical protein